MQYKKEEIETLLFYIKIRFETEYQKSTKHKIIGAWYILRQ